MSSAKRRINSTGRKKILHESIDLRLLQQVPGEPLKAKVGLNLEKMGLPASAAICLEAYHQGTAMRFDCGSVGTTTIPDVLVLEELDQATGVLFRIKIVDRDTQPGKILASADRIRASVEGEHTGRQSIFPVDYRDLGQEIWRVEIDDDAGPLLVLNSKVPALMHRVMENPLLAGALMPAAFRIVLEHLSENPAEDDEDGEGWKSRWKRFFSEGLGTDEDPADLEDDDDARKTWVSDLVRRYCESKTFVESSRQLIGDHAHG